MLRINTIFSSYKQIQSLLICATNSDLSNQIQVGVISNRRVIFLRGKTKPKVQLNSFAAFHTTLQHCCKVSKKELDFKAFENSEQKNKEAFFEAVKK